jgi:hypothetical protein
MGAASPQGTDFRTAPEMHFLQESLFDAASARIDPPHITYERESSSKT